MHPTTGTHSCVNMILSIFAEKDAVPFAFYSSLMDAIKHDIKEYALDSFKANTASVTGKMKAKAHVP